MKNLQVDRKKFIFELLPDFAAFVLENKLEEYSAYALEFAREEELPLLQSLSKFTEEELIQIGKESAAEFLTALANNEIHIQIEQNIHKWISNQIEFVDQFDIVAEDITLLSFIRRKALYCLLGDYTSDHDLKKKLIIEIDKYTTREQLISHTTFLRIQQENIRIVNDKLKFQERLLLEAQELTNMGSYFVDYHHEENSYSTPQMSEITGLSVKIENRDFFDAVHPDDRQHVLDQWLKVYHEGGTFDYIFRYIRDTERWLHSRGNIVFENGERKHLNGTIRDITKEQNLLLKLIRSEELHKEAQKLTKLGNWSWTIATNEIMWSDEMYRIYGLVPQSEDITFERFASLIHPDDRESRISEISKGVESGVFNNYIVRILNPDGVVKILQGHGTIEKDSAGKPVKISGTCQDITREHQLKTELVSLNSSLSDKNQELTNINKELESFNYIASHDLQEPLRKIRIYSGRLLDSESTLSDSAVNAVNKVLTSATRMQRLIADLIEFSQISSPSEAFEIVPIRRIIEDVMFNYNEQIENGTAVITAQPLPYAKVIPFQFTQLLNNIIGNAIKYKCDNKTVEIKIGGEFVTVRNESKDISEEYFKLSIADNGIGFEPGQRDKIFELFKRLHAGEKYTGTGIGLAICKKIITNHHGFITADSEPGQGSTFNIYLPATSIVPHSTS